MSLARTILRFEWRRFLPALLSVAFAGVLMLVQLGLLMGMFGTVTVLVDASAADIWVTAPATQSVDQAQDLPASLATLMRLSPDIVRTATLSLRDAVWRAADGTKVNVTLVGLSPDADSLACPQPMKAQLCALLAIPGAVIVDRSEAGKLGAEVGAGAEIGGHRVHVAALALGMRSIGSTYVFTSQQTLRGLETASSGGERLTSFLLGQVADPARTKLVRKRLQRVLQHETARVWTSAQLSRQSQGWWLRESGVGAGFLFSTLLGVVIAIVVTSQSLRTVILSQVREYAAFRAIGVPVARLAGVVMEQAAWIGALGMALTGGLVLLLALLAKSFYVPFALSGGGVVAAGAIGLLTAIGSGLLALRELNRLEPAVLLR
jgi:putative ABC transport system permease protein